MMSHISFLAGYFFFNDTATTEIYTLSLHDALPITASMSTGAPPWWTGTMALVRGVDRKSTRLNSSHITTSYAVFCLKKKIRERDDRLVDERTSDRHPLMLASRKL